MSEDDKPGVGGPIETGADYLKRIGEEYVSYKQFLPGLSDAAFRYQKELGLHRDGVEGFMADFAIAAEERRRNLVRWRTSEKLPNAPEEKVDLIRAALPRFVMFNKEAVGGMRVERAEHHKVDVVVEDVMTEIARRLPRTLDAYRYHQGYAGDSLEVPGIGKIDVKLMQTANGIFSTISEIKADKFRVWNCRDSGVKYLDRFNEISRPTDVEIPSENVKLEVYSDGSGDEQRNPTKFKETEDKAIVWLVDNVLNPIRKTAVPEKQIDLPPMEEPFPEDKIGPLFAFVEMEDLERIEILKDNLSRAYPDERAGVHPSLRLIPLTYDRQDLPETVHDGFVWCGVGKIDESTDMGKLEIAKNERRSWGIGGTNEGVAEIKPLVATDVYVVDWQAWDDFREKTFTPEHDRLTDGEVAEMYRSVGRTFIPITEYKGDYKKAVVLIGRDLEVNEVGKIYYPPEEKRE